MKNIVVIYHGDCPDGFSGAWAAYKKFGDKAEYLPGFHNNTPSIDGLKDKEIYFVDFIYSDKIVNQLTKDNRRVTAIDHHISGEVLVKTTKDYSYAVDHSGAVLSWKYFHPEKKVPRMLEHIEDRDLYKFKLSNSRAICSFIDSFDFDFKIWDKLADDLEDSSKLKSYVEKGEIIVGYEEELIRRLIDDNSKLIQFEGFETFVVNAPHMFASDIGHALCLEKPPIGVVWSEGKDLVRVSLRSDGTVDVSKIAEKFGGGGHKGAAGFRLPSIKSFPWKEVKN